MEEKRAKFPDGIPQIGADALRFTLCSYNVKNHFINLDMNSMKRHRLLVNKLWQATRFLFRCLDTLPPPPSPSLKSIDVKVEQHPAASSLVNRWINSRLHSMIDKIDTSFRSYDFHQATDALSKFLFSELCDVFLEAIKPLNGIEKATSTMILVRCLDVSLRCLAPFMPYVSEELYQRLHSELERRSIVLARWESILIADYPKKDEWALWRNEQVEHDVDVILLAIAEIRGIKLQYGITKSKPDCIFVCPGMVDNVDQISQLISTLAVCNAHIQLIHSDAAECSSGKHFVSRTITRGSVHIDLSGIIDPAAESKKCRKKLEKLKRNLERMTSIVDTAGYVSSAPMDVQRSHRKKMDSLRQEIDQLENYAVMIRNLTR